MDKYFLAGSSIILSSIAQLLLKKGADLTSKIENGGFISLFLNKFTFIGLCCYGVGALLWIRALSKMNLSVAYPLVSLSYVITTILAYFFLSEKIGSYQIIGLILIIGGTVFITR